MLTPNGQTYTYRNGKKVPLAKQPDQIVARAKPELLIAMGFEEVEQVSPASTRIRTTMAELEPSMSLLRHVAVTHHAYVRETTQEEFLITDRLFITFKEGVSMAEVDAFAGKYSLAQKKKYNEQDYLFQLTDHTGMNPVKLVVRLTEDEPLVERVDHSLNCRMKKCDFELPGDPEYYWQWHLHQHHVDPDFDLRASTRCEEAWQLLGHFGSPDVVVGITDDGCRMDHVDFNSDQKFASWGYFIGNRLITRDDFDARPENMYVSGENDGTSVAGVIAGEVDATHTVGAAPGCRLLPIRWESNEYGLLVNEDKLIDALDCVADKADILSNSWGSSPMDDWPGVVVSRIRQLALSGGRRGKGILFLWAAGNQNCPIQYSSDIDIPYTSGWYYYGMDTRIWIGVQTAREFYNTLVGIPGLMHVTALASTAQRSHYSNYGPGILIAAPSSNGHEYGRASLMGLDITTTTGGGTGVTHEFGGTSSATPLVAGIAALALSANPALSAQELVAVLCKTAAKDLNFTGYPCTEPAYYDLDTSWDVSPVPPFDTGEFRDEDSAYGSWSPWFGHGRVDALEAVALALRMKEEGGVETQFDKVSSPAMAIPDNSLEGVSDAIHCPEAGRLTGIRVSVDISHTYRGDLVVSLTAPSGKTVILHNRKGGSENGQKQTYDPQTLPQLGALSGSNVQGDWVLKVEDRASMDRGQLNSWSLHLLIDPTEMIEIAEQPGVTIPDNQPEGIERSLQLAREGRIRGLEVSVDITHTYIGDLKVSLVAPDDAKALLHNRSGGGTDNLIRTYSMDAAPALAALKGKSFQGAWKLQVADEERLDQGKLNAWVVRIFSEN